MEHSEAPVVKWEIQAKLEPTFKAKWIKALRSGDYQQCVGRLRKQGGYCCLGVAEEIMFPVTGNSWGTPLRLDGDSFPVVDKVGGPSSVTDPSQFLRRLTNIQGQNGNINPELYEEVRNFVKVRLIQREISIDMTHIDTRYSLAGYNDMGVPFSIIADVIEEFF